LESLWKQKKRGVAGDISYYTRFEGLPAYIKAKEDSERA